MKISLCIIGTGKYVQFLDPLIKSINTYMFCEYDKTIFVFTDTQTLNIKNINVEYISHLPVLLTTLLKFTYLNRISKNLMEGNLIYYIDSDCLVVDTINKDVFPDDENQLVTVLHPLRRSGENLYETNFNSLAYVIDGNTSVYFQGCFFGGYTNAVLTMIDVLDKNIRLDLKNNIIAKWHDESHLNKYLLKNSPKKLHGGYAYPDPKRWRTEFPFDKKIIHYNCASL